MKIRFLLISLLFIITCNAQSERELYIKKVNQICTNADIIEIEVKDDYVEIEYLCNDKLYEIGLNLEKELVFLETEADIPEMTLYKIHKKLDKKYFGWMVDEYTYVQMQDTAFYKVEIMRDGIEDNVYFSLDGKYYRAKNVVINESWNINELSQSVYYRKSSYDFLKPERTYEMPEILKEISGIAIANDSTLYCIQDETGIIFKYNTKREELSGMLRFTDKGDFEDISIKNDSVFALRSDGTVFYFNHIKFNGKVNQIVVPLNCMNIEGLYYNPSDHMLYISCKDPLFNDYGALKTIYRLSIDNLINPQIALTINLEEINKMVTEKYPAIKTNKLQFNPSAIAVHPQTNDIYVLSASNRLLAIFTDSRLTQIYPLPAEIYYKPEGLAFTTDGNLYISSEGMKKGYGNGLIFYFSQKQQD